MCGLVQLFSEHVGGSPTRRPDHQACSGGTAAQHFLHVFQCYGDAARRRGKIFPRQVKENGAAAALDAGPLVVAGLHHNIIEMVGTFQILVGRGIGQIHPAIIVPVACRFAPAPAAPNRRNRQFRLGPDEAVTAVVVARNGETPDPAALIAEIKKNFANYKVPKQVYVVDDLPRNAMGKVQKALLRERFGK